MFDARSLLENLVRGAGQPSQQAGGGGSGDLLVNSLEAWVNLLQEQRQVVPVAASMICCAS